MRCRPGWIERLRIWKPSSRTKGRARADSKHGGSLRGFFMLEHASRAIPRIENARSHRSMLSARNAARSDAQRACLRRTFSRTPATSMRRARAICNTNDRVAPSLISPTCTRRSHYSIPRLLARQPMRFARVCTVCPRARRIRPVRIGLRGIAGSSSIPATVVVIRAPSARRVSRRAASRSMSHVDSPNVSRRCPVASAGRFQTRIARMTKM